MRPLFSTLSACVRRPARRAPAATTQAVAGSGTAASSVASSRTLSSSANSKPPVTGLAAAVVGRDVEAVERAQHGYPFFGGGQARGHLELVRRGGQHAEATAGAEQEVVAAPGVVGLYRFRHQCEAGADQGHAHRRGHGVPRIGGGAQIERQPGTDFDGRAESRRRGEIGPAFGAVGQGQVAGWVPAVGAPLQAFAAVAGGSPALGADVEAGLDDAGLRGQRAGREAGCEPARAPAPASSGAPGSRSREMAWHGVFHSNHSFKVGR